MKKLGILLLCLGLLCGCQSRQNEEVTQQPTKNIYTGTNILIAYFTWADNTYVEDPSTIDQDVSTSASILVPGNTAKMAEYIQQEVGGDLFSIVVDEPYSSDYDLCLDRASDELANNARPTLMTKVENINQYDVIFIGYPNWWATCPMAIFSFIESYDLTEKTIIPFCAHETGELGSSIEDLEVALPNSTFLEPIGVYRPDVNGSEALIKDWLQRIGMESA